MAYHAKCPLKHPSEEEECPQECSFMIRGREGCNDSTGYNETERANKVADDDCPAAPDFIDEENGAKLAADAEDV